MNLVNELGSDIAMAFLFERKYRERLDGSDVVELISRVRFVLEPASGQKGDDAPRSFHSTEDRPLAN